MSAGRVYSVYPRTALVPIVDRFEYTDNVGWRWLQKICFAVLRWIGAYATEYITVQHVSLDAEKLSTALIAKHIHEVNALMYKPSRLILGAEDWHELMDDPVIFSAIRFSAPVDLRNGRQQVMGLDVTIVPWMRGMVVLPKEVA